MCFSCIIEEYEYVKRVPLATVTFYFDKVKVQPEQRVGMFEICDNDVIDCIHQA
jgi:hypothetical protein